MALELLERDLVADSVDLHAAVPAILDVSRQAQLMGRALGKIAESHSLHSSRDSVLSGDLLNGLAHGDVSEQRCHSTLRLFPARKDDGSKLRRIAGDYTIHAVRDLAAHPQRLVEV